MINRIYGWMLAIQLLAISFAEAQVTVKQQQILESVGKMLKEKHYQPKIFDDAFSKAIWNSYLGKLDAEHNILLVSDIQSLKKFETSLDDEINGSPIVFYPAAVAVYTKRLQEVALICNRILEKPFFFNKKDLIKPNASADFSLNEKDREERWRLKLKALTLKQFMELKAQPENVDPAGSTQGKTDVELEKEAREKTAQLINRLMARLRMNTGEHKQFVLFVNTVTESFDPHTEFLPPSDEKAMQEKMDAKFYGIGIVLKEKDLELEVNEILPGGPAWKDGQLQPNDLVLKVGQGDTGTMEDVAAMDVQDAGKIIRGAKGSSLRVSVKTANGLNKTVTLVRDEIIAEELRARSAVIAHKGKKIGYIFLPQFYAAKKDKPDGAHAAKDVENELIRLRQEKIDGVIVDLRNNGGGSLEEVVNMVGLFIKKGPIVQLKEKGTLNVLVGGSADHEVYSGALTVLVNANSASASEIFSAAIQDYKRGIVIGSPSTYGKGTAQSQRAIEISLDDTVSADPMKILNNGVLQFTGAKFYRVTGASTQLKGVIPDIVLPDMYEYTKTGEREKLSPMVWDEIAPVPFNVDLASPDISSIKTLSTERVKNNKSFQNIKIANKWIQEAAKKPIHLKAAIFKKELDILNSYYEKRNKSMSLAKEDAMKVSFTEKDSTVNDTIEAEKRKVNLRWIDQVGQDIYIREAANVINDIIGK